MKKRVTAIGLIIMSTTIILLITGVNFNRFGASYYFTQIKESEASDENSLITASTYEYTLQAYSKNGIKKELTFTTKQNIQQETYLLLYFKEKKGVTSYKEIDPTKIPQKALNALE